MTRDEAIEAIRNNWPDERYSMLREALDVALAALSTPAPVAPDDALVSGDVAAFPLPEVADSDEAGPCVTCGAVLGATMQTLEADPPPLWRHAVTECNEAHIALDVAGVPKSQQMRRVRGPDGDEDVTIGLKERIRRLALMSPAPPPAKDCRNCETCCPGCDDTPAPVDPPPAVAGIDWDAERDRCDFPSYKE